MRRILIAGIVGGVIVFIWGAVSHMLLPLGGMGMHVDATPDQQAVLESMKQGLGESGLYMLPGLDMSIADETARMEDVETKWGAGPAAIVVYHADGGPTMGPQLLINEGVSNILCAIIAAILLAAMNVSYAARVVLVTLMGVFTWLAVDVSYWNWYGFPDDYTLAQGIGQSVGWLLAGLVMAAMVRPKRMQS